MSQNESEGGVRLDKWLWAARFYKTRSLATEAINGGLVHLNGQRTKPGREVKTGAQLTIRKDQYEWQLTVLGLARQRRPAKDAILLYEESPESHARRQAEVARRRDAQDHLDAPARRPNKRDRRQIHRFKRA